MAAEQYANKATTTLSGDITSGATSIFVADATRFPTVPQFRIIIQNELLRVSDVSSNNFTVERGIEGTTAAAHSSGVTVSHILTSGSLGGLGNKTTSSSGFIYRPASGNVGQVFLPASGFYIQREDHNHVWRSWGPLFYMKPPSSGDFTWVNQGAATIEVEQGGIYLFAPGNASSSLKILKMTAPATPYTVTIGFIPALPTYSGIFPGCGFCWRQSSSSKLLTYAYTLENDPNSRAIPRLAFQKWTNETTFSANYVPGTFVDLPPFMVGPVLWYQATDNGTNLITRVSNDGKHFFQFMSQSRTDFMTVSGPNEIGFWANSNTSTTDVGMLLLSWDVS